MSEGVSERVMRVKARVNVSSSGGGGGGGGGMVVGDRIEGSTDK